MTWMAPADAKIVQPDVLTQRLAPSAIAVAKFAPPANFRRLRRLHAPCAAVGPTTAIRPLLKRGMILSLTARAVHLRPLAHPIALAAAPARRGSISTMQANASAAEWGGGRQPPRPTNVSSARVGLRPRKERELQHVQVVVPACTARVSQKIVPPVPVAPGHRRGPQCVPPACSVTIRARPGAPVVQHVKWGGFRAMWARLPVLFVLWVLIPHIPPVRPAKPVTKAIINRRGGKAHV